MNISTTFASLIALLLACMVMGNNALILSVSNAPSRSVLMLRELGHTTPDFDPIAGIEATGTAYQEAYQEELKNSSRRGKILGKLKAPFRRDANTNKDRRLTLEDRMAAI